MCAYRSAREAFTLLEDVTDRLFERREPVTLDNRGEAPLAGAARGDLRAEIAEYSIRHPCVVGDQSVDRRNRLTGSVEAQLTDAKTLLVDLREPGGPRTGDCATHVDHVPANHREGDETAVDEDGRVGGDVVDVRPDGERIVADVHIARLERIQADELEPIADDLAHVGEEHRQTGCAGEDTTRRIDESDTDVLDLMDARAVSRALDIGHHLVAGGDEAMADHRGRHRIRLRMGRRHAALTPTRMRTWCPSSTTALSAGPITTLVAGILDDRRSVDDDAGLEHVPAQDVTLRPARHRRAAPVVPVAGFRHRRRSGCARNHGGFGTSETAVTRSAPTSIGSDGALCPYRSACAAWNSAGISVVMCVPCGRVSVSGWN